MKSLQLKSLTRLNKYHLMRFDSSSKSHQVVFTALEITTFQSIQG